MKMLHCLIGIAAALAAHLRPSVYVRRLIGAVCCSGLLAQSVSAAIQIDGFSTQVNDRFANDAQFIGKDFDWSGVGLADDGRWLTMVSENVFLSAHHYFPANGSDVTFYSSNDASGGSVTRSIQSSQRIGSSDLRIGTLNAGLGAGFSFYNFATGNIASLDSGAYSTRFTSSPYYLADAYLLGRSPSAFAVSQGMAIGRNRLDQWFDAVTGSGTTDDALASRVDASGEANYLPNEAYLQEGDSGAPLMVETSPGELTIVGINWFIASGNGSNYNGASYVGNYDVEIQNFIDANPVPELRRAALLLGLVVLCMGVGRRARI